MRSTFFVLAAAGAALANDNAANFDRDTVPQGYGGAVTQIADGQVQAPSGYTPAETPAPYTSSAVAPPAYSSSPVESTPPAYSSSPVESAPPVYSSPVESAPPAYSSSVSSSVSTPSSPVAPAPPAYTPAVPTTPVVVNATTPVAAPYPTGPANGTTLSTSAPIATTSEVTSPSGTTPASPAQQSGGAAAGIQVSLGVVFAGLFTLFL